MNWNANNCGGILTRWARRILSSNPFYLASAGLLLYGVNRLSSDPQLTGAELLQIKFNFCALFAYEILLVFTAIILARRSIWYDAQLLVGLENLFVLIPFSFVSRAVLMDSSLAHAMCLAAVFFGALKFLALKHYIPQLNLSGRLLCFGTLFLLANVAVGLLFQRLEDNRAALAHWLQLSWIVGMPVLAALANLLPKLQHAGTSVGPRSWFPHVMPVIWVAVTGFHLGGVGYVYVFDWRPALLAPVLWIFAWTLRHRMTDFAASPSVVLERSLFLLPLAITLIAVDDSWIFSSLNLLNSIFYAAMCLRNRRNALALAFSTLALAAALSGLPESLARHMMPEFDRIFWTFGSSTLCAVCLVLFLRDPIAGLLGGAGLFAISGLICGQAGLPRGLAVQAGLVFVTMHSLRWFDQLHRGARTARMVAMVVWIAHSFLWVRTDGRFAAVAVSLAAGVVLIAYAVHKLLTRDWSPRVIPCGALTVMLSAPGNELAEKLQATSVGFLAVAASFLLFAAGTWLALTKPKWNRAGEIDA